MRIDQFISGAAVDSLTDALLLVDPAGTILDANVRALECYGYPRDSMVGMTFRDLVAPQSADVATPARIPDNSAEPPGEMEHLRADGSVFPVEIRATAVEADGQRALVYSVRDITKRKTSEAAHRDMLIAMLNVIGSVSESRDPYTAGHERRVSELATAVATEMGLSEEDVSDIRVAGLIHDIGKVSVPAEILSVAGQLSSIEFEIVKDHSEAGYQILSSAHMDSDVTELVYQHHERCDGSGYPRALTADDLLIGSKILMVADVVEAMSSPRPHRPALGVEPALSEIVDGAGTKYDPQVAAVCVRLFREQGFAFSEAQDPIAEQAPPGAPRA